MPLGSIRSNSSPSYSDEEILQKIEDGTFQLWYESLSESEKMKVVLILIRLQSKGLIRGLTTVDFHGKPIYMVTSVESNRRVNPHIFPDKNQDEI
jgi:hypothetical protein